MKQNVKMLLIHKKSDKRTAFTTEQQFKKNEANISKEWRVATAEEFKEYMFAKHGININLETLKDEKESKRKEKRIEGNENGQKGNEGKEAHEKIQENINKNS